MWFISALILRRKCNVGLLYFGYWIRRGVKFRLNAVGAFYLRFVCDAVVKKTMINSPFSEC